MAGINLERYLGSLNNMGEIGSDSAAKTTGKTVSRRGFVKGVTGIIGAAVAAPLLVSVAQASPQSSRESSQNPDANPAPAAQYFDKTKFWVKDKLQLAGQNVNFLGEYSRLGGEDFAGYPISRPFFRKEDGFVYQAFQRTILQWRPEVNQAWPVNTMDLLSDAGKDDWLDKRGIPKPIKEDGSGGDFQKAKQVRLGWMTDPTIKRTYLNSPDPISAYGLPTSMPEKRGPFVIQRFQRGGLQLWVEDVEGMPAPGSVVGVLAGQLVKDANVFIPQDALVEETADSNGNIQILSQTTISAEPQKTPSAELLSRQDYFSQMQLFIEASGRKGYVEQFKGRMSEIAQSLKIGPGRIIPSKKYPEYTFARDGFWALMTLQDKDFTQQVVDRFRADQKNNPDGHYATALLNDDSKPYKRDRDEESTMMLVLEQFLLHKLGGNVDTNSLSRAYSFIQQHIRNGEYVTSGDPHPEEAGTYHYWLDTFRNPTGSVIAYNQGLLPPTLRALKEMGVAVDDNTINQAEDRYRALANPVLIQRKNSSTIDISAMVGEALSLYFFDRSILGRDKVLATYDHVTNNATKVTRGNRFVGFKVISNYQGGFLSQGEFNDSIDTPGSYQNGGSWALYDELLLYSAIRHGASNQAKELFLQRMESEGATSHEFINTTPGSEGTADSTRDNYGWNTFAARLLP